MEDVRDLKALQIDALREVANIGAGHAATALSQMTDRRIMISVPQINIARLEDVSGLLGEPTDVVAAVLMHMLGDLTGRTLLLLPEASGRRLCDMLLRRPPGTTTVYDTLEQSCLKEAGNILVRRLHERPLRFHGDAAAAVGAEPGGGLVGGRAHHDVSQFWT